MRRLALALVVAALLPGCAATGRGAAWEETAPTPEAWVDAQLAPALARRLGDHPRFAGASLAVGLPPAARPGREGAHTRLEQRLEAVLESRLLHAGGLRLRARQAAACEPDPADYAMGFVVNAMGGESRVELRVLETGSGEWIAGLADSWQGPLSRRDLADQAAPATPVADPGTRARPFEPGEAELAARALARDLSCELAAARLRPGPVAPDSDPLAPLAAAYLAALGHPRSGTAPWQLAIRRAPDGAGVEALVATLSSGEGAVTARRYLRSAPASVPTRAPTLASPARPPAPPVLEAGHCDPGCLAVRIDDRADTALFAVVPGRGLTGIRGCALHIDPAGGTHVRIPAQDARWAAVYALRAGGATGRRLARLEASLPSACGAAGVLTGAEGLDALAALRADAAGDIAWARLDLVDPNAPGEMP